MLWVHATLVEASRADYTRFVHPLSAAEQRRYYPEMAVVARLFGTPTDVIPPTLADFRDYFDAQIAGETITVTAAAKEVAHVIFEAPLPTPIRPARPRTPALDRRAPAAAPARGMRTTLEPATRARPAPRRTLVKLAATPALIAASRLTAPTRALAT
jgi:uncharacterized protein (DUF2236 family)